MSSHRNTEAIHGELGEGLAWSLLGEERKPGKVRELKIVHGKPQSESRLLT